MKSKERKKLPIMILLCFMLLFLTIYNVNTRNLGEIGMRPWCEYSVKLLGALFIP